MKRSLVTGAVIAAIAMPAAALAQDATKTPRPRAQLREHRQEHRQERREDRQENRQERRQDRQENRQEKRAERRENRQERRHDRREHRQERREKRRDHRQDRRERWRNHREGLRDKWQDYREQRRERRQDRRDRLQDARKHWRDYRREHGANRRHELSQTEKAQIRRFLEKHPRLAKRIFAAADQDHNGVLSPDERARGLAMLKHYRQNQAGKHGDKHQAARRLHDRLDRNDDGKVGPRELHRAKKLHEARKEAREARPAK